MPIIEVTLLEGRSTEQKEGLIAALTDATVTAIGAQPESIRVVLREVPPEHFGIAGSSIARRRGAAPAS